MRKIRLGNTGMEIPAIAVGCMRLPTSDIPKAERFLRTAVEAGANFFDHADIYGGGKCEEAFSEAFGLRKNPSLRESIFIQSKCGIRSGMYDHSKEHIIGSAEAILKRLGTDYLDALLLHRPDALSEPAEVAAAFYALHASGKARHFGVSNHNPPQIRLLEKCVRQPISVNQLQFSIMNATMISYGINVNTPFDGALDRDGGVLDFCRLNGITIQPWSPFQYGFFEGVFLGSPKFPELNAKIDEIAAKYGVSAETIVIAWILTASPGQDAARHGDDEYRAAARLY